MSFRRARPRARIVATGGFWGEPIKTVRVTRWTNLYFPGDIIGGAVASLFGKGIKDVKLRFASRGWLDRLIPARSHTRYWDYPSERHASEELTKALHLNDLYKEKLRDGGFPR